MSGREQTKREELANTITHAAGIVFCIIAIPFLLNYADKAGTKAGFWGAAVFGTGMLLMYTCSTCYHAVRNKRLKRALKTGDHISIYFLIAGTYTPLAIRYLPHQKAAPFLFIIWSLVVLGIFFKLFFINRFEFISVILYLGMGWMIVFIFNTVMQHMPVSIFVWVLAGGLSYTAGVYFYVRDKVSFFHSIWHCFVLGGTIAHYVFVYKSLQV